MTVDGPGLGLAIDDTGHPNVPTADSASQLMLDLP